MTKPTSHGGPFMLPGERGRVLWIAVAILAISSLCHVARAAHSDIAGTWHLDEGVGQVADDASGHSNNGQLGSTDVVDGNDPTWTSGKLGSAALHFGGDDFVEVQDSATLEAPTITAEAWVRSLSTPDTSSYILAKGAFGCTAASYAIYTGPTWLHFYISNYGGDPIAVFSPNAGTGVWDGNWHHVAGTFDGAMVRLYVDGAEVGSGTPSPIAIAYGTPTHDRLYIGTYQGGGCFLPFTGDIDEVRVWTRALSPAEVALRAQGQELTPSAVEQVRLLIDSTLPDLVATGAVPPATATSMTTTLTQAEMSLQQSLAAPNTTAAQNLLHTACNQFRATLNQINAALRARKISPDTAAQLTDAVTVAMTTAGCN